MVLGVSIRELVLGVQAHVPTAPEFDGVASKGIGVNSISQFGRQAQQKQLGGVATDPNTCQRTRIFARAAFGGSHRHRSFAARPWIEQIVLALVRNRYTSHAV